MLVWDISSLASSLKISETETVRYFSDGRRLSPLVERRFANEVFQGDLSKSEGAEWDLVDYQGNKVEVRCLSKYGLSFAPSRMSGAGRSFDSDGFVDKLAHVHLFAIADATKFPVVPYWVIPSDLVFDLFADSSIGSTGRLGYAKAVKLLKKLSS